MSRTVGTRLLWLALVNLPLAPVLAKAADGGQGWDHVSSLLDKHCARCHEVGKTTGRFKDRPAGEFGFVLDMPKLVSRNKLVPGNADASPIFVKIQKGEMPKDISDKCYDGTATATDYCGLSKEETSALHDAINGLQQPPPEAAIVAEASAPTMAQPDGAPPMVVQQPPPADYKAPPLVVQTPGTPGYQAPPVVVQVPATPGYQPPPVVVQPPNYQAPPTSVAVAPPFITDRDIIRMISDDAAKASDLDRYNYRYFTFTHLYNAGEPEKDMRVYRMSLAKLLNSLSTVSDPVVPYAIDPAQTIYRVDISRLGWSKATWDYIVASDPYVIYYHNSQFKALEHELQTQVPFVRADWFTFAASRPPLYYTILDLPKTKGELQHRLGMNGQQDIEARKVERAGFLKSGVSDNNRMVERHAISTGMYWESYDFGSNAERKNIFQFPLGPQGNYNALAAKFGFTQDGGEIIFSLPNGFHAYYLTDGKGNRLDTGPTKIVHDGSQRDLSVTNGISCMGCHDQGMKYNSFRPGQPLDQVRELVLKSGSYPSEVKEIVSAIFPAGEAFTKRLDTDAKRYADSLAAAGVNVKTKSDGVEMINALSKRFEENLDARLAAAELGMQPDAFMERLNAAGGQAYDLKLRLQQDLVPRDQFVALFAKLVNTINDDGDVAIDLTKVAAHINAGTTSYAPPPVDTHAPGYKPPVVAYVPPVVDTHAPDYKPPVVAHAPTYVPPPVDTHAEGYAPPVYAPLPGYAKPSYVSKTFDLAFYANAQYYKVGDYVTFTLKSEQPCFLTLVDTDDKGRSLVLFPNGYHPDSRIEAGVSIQVPGDIVSGFKIRAPSAGIEHITASCNASYDANAGHDYSKDKFAGFESTRALVDAQVNARRANQNRLLALEAAPGQGQKPGSSGGQPGGSVALVANPIEPLIPISSQKSVVIQVRGQ